MRRPIWKCTTIERTVTPQSDYRHPKFECTQLRVFWQYRVNMTLLKTSFIKDSYCGSKVCIQPDLSAWKMIFDYARKINLNESTFQSQTLSPRSFGSYGLSRKKKDGELQNSNESWTQISHADLSRSQTPFAKIVVVLGVVPSSN